MYVDTELIEWLLENETQYKISKETGVSQSILSRLSTGERKIENLKIITGVKLTEYAQEKKRE